MPDVVFRAQDGAHFMSGVNQIRPSLVVCCTSAETREDFDTKFVGPLVHAESSAKGEIVLNEVRDCSCL